MDLHERVRHFLPIDDMGRRSRKWTGFGMPGSRSREVEDSRLRSQAFPIDDDSVRRAFADLKADGAKFMRDGRLGDNWSLIEKVIAHRRHREDRFWGDWVDDITAYEVGLLVMDRALTHQCEVTKKPLPQLTESARKKLVGDYETPTPDEVFEIQREGFKRIARELLFRTIDPARFRSFLMGARDYSFMLHHLQLSEKSSHKKGKKGKK